jgi:hypothetical protein
MDTRFSGTSKSNGEISDKTEDRLPKSLEDMTFDNYHVLVSHGDNWPTFQKIFGNSRTRIGAKLMELRDLRNAIFHFKREITLEDHQVLVVYRDWLLNKVKQAQANNVKEKNP